MFENLIISSAHRCWAAEGMRATEHTGNSCWKMNCVKSNRTIVTTIRRGELFDRNRGAEDSPPTTKQSHQKQWMLLISEGQQASMHFHFRWHLPQWH
jgi:hypothetical protein